MPSDSSAARASRLAITSGGSVPRPSSRLRSSPALGGVTKSSRQSGISFLICRAPSPGTIQYIGIARDEQERLLRLEDGRQVSLLEKYNFTEKDAWEFCRKAGLLSPVYAFTDRGGCWFCPNAKRAELRHLYDHHPDLWARMLALQAIPGKTTEKFNRTQRFSDIDAIFRQEDGEAASRQAVA